MNECNRASCHVQYVLQALRDNRSLLMRLFFCCCCWVTWDPMPNTHLKYIPVNYTEDLICHSFAVYPIGTQYGSNIGSIHKAFPPPTSDISNVFHPQANPEMLGTLADINLSVLQKNLCSPVGLSLVPFVRQSGSRPYARDKLQDSHLPTAVHAFLFLFFNSTLAVSWLMARQGVITQANEYTCWEASRKQAHKGFFYSSNHISIGKNEEY